MGTYDNPNFDEDLGRGGMGCGTIFLAFLFSIGVMVSLFMYQSYQKNKRVEMQMALEVQKEHELMERKRQEAQKAEEAKKLERRSKIDLIRIFAKLENPDIKIRRQALKEIKQKKVKAAIYFLKDKLRKETNSEMLQEMNELIQYLQELIDQNR